MLTIIFKQEKKQQKFKDITIKSTKTTQRKHVTKKYVEHNITICICKFLQKIHTHQHTKTPHYPHLRYIHHTNN